MFYFFFNLHFSVFFCFVSKWIGMCSPFIVQFRMWLHLCGVVSKDREIHNRISVIFFSLCHSDSVLSFSGLQFGLTMVGWSKKKLFFFLFSYQIFHSRTFSAYKNFNYYGAHSNGFLPFIFPTQKFFLVFLQSFLRFVFCRIHLRFFPYHVSSMSYFVVEFV